MNTPDETPLDDRLRAAYDFMSAPAEEVPPPPAGLWAGIDAGLRAGGAPAPTRAALWRAATGGLVLGGLLAILLVWWVTPQWHGTSQTKTAGAKKDAKALAPVPNVAPSIDNTESSAPNSVADAYQNTSTPSHEVAASYPGAATTYSITGAHAQPVAAPSNIEPHPSLLVATGYHLVADTSQKVPATSNMGEGGANNRQGGVPVVPVIFQPLLTSEQILVALPTDSSRTTRERRRQTLQEQRAALLALTHRTDSLLLALNEAPPTPPAAPQDSTKKAPALRRWSVLLAFAPERNFFGLQSPAGDSLTALRHTHEQGRAGYNAALMAEYRLTDHWSIAGGAGLSAYGAELRLTDRRTTVSTRYDTIETLNVRVTYNTTRAYSVRIVQDTALSPLFNLNGQIIGYQKVLVPRNDTLWTVNNVTNYDTVRTKTVEPEVTKTETVATRVLRPSYRFLTLPIAVRYRFGTDGGTFGGPNASRWWTDVAVGAQLQFFLGGTQLRTTDGRSFVTERVGPRGGPFRPVSVAFMGALTVNYALTPRLSVSMAPTLRWQAQSVYKHSTGLTQKPTATGIQFGLRMTL